MEPHSGMGGCAPRPRKESAEIMRTTLPVSIVPSTKHSPAALGTRCPKSTFMLEAPVTRANCTKPAELR